MKRIETNSLAFRLVAGAALWSLVSLAGVGIVLSSLFRDSAERAFDARLLVFSDTLVAGSDVRPDGQLAMTATLGDPRFEQALSGWYWQIEGPRGVGAPAGPDMRSRSLWDNLLAAPARHGPGTIGRGDLNGPDGQRLRAVSRDIRLPGSGLPFVFTVAGDRGELEREVSRFNQLLSWSLLGLGFGLIVAIVVLIRIGIAPLRRVSEALAAIRSGRADKLEGSFPSEIQPLADELNALVAHNATLLERARRHVGNIAHALKTPISVLVNETNGPAPPSVEVLHKQLRIMRAQVDHYLSRARMAAASGLITSRTSVASVVNDLARTLKRIYSERDLEYVVDTPENVVFRGEQEDLEEMAGNLMDNASKWAKSKVHVAASVQIAAGGPVLTLVIEDDGPGLDPEQIQVLRRGTRLDESVPGSGLGLSIVREISELYGGTLVLERSATFGGLRAELRLPAGDRMA